MPTSTIPAFIDGLLSRLQARPALLGVHVTDFKPDEQEQDDWIMLDGAEPSEQEAAALGRLRREEEFFHEILVSCVRSYGDPQKTARDRAFALVQEVENELRDDPTVGLVVRECQVITVKLENRADGQRREARVTVRIRARHRI